ncbi:restriction endonuclease subunit S [Magnetospirillum sp. ME-1]|uniref:restriction endonuclease subunit S n=1 Tax=Magnetospirillum sp. ME-1 TaxID=1639348 RepID=UPI000A1998C7|nr:restriction endonuclease subunit S [Magnetospirillum sp. ME-1]
MEVRPGYRQTDVGIIPEEWNVVEAFDLDPFITSGSRGWAKYYSDRGSLFMRITNLSRDCIHPDLTDQKFVDLPENDTEGLRTALQDGDILVSITADIGIIGYINRDVPKPAYINQHIACLRLTPEKADPLFQSYYLASYVPQKLFREMTDVGAKTGINLTTVGKLKLLCPPLPEQRAIAAALSDVDALLDGLDQLIAKKRDLKQAAMQQLLTGQIRLPGFQGEWEVKRLGEVADIDPENLTSDTRPDFSFNYIALEDVDRGTLRSHTELVFAVAPSRARRKLRPGDLLVSTVRPNLKSHLLFAGGPGNWICSTGFCVVRSRQDVTSPPYLIAHLFASCVSRQIEALLTGSNYPAINSRDVSALEIPIPPFAEQSAIAAVLSDMDKELAALELQREKTRAIKHAMMQELLTGKTRLV